MTSTPIPPTSNAGEFVCWLGEQLEGLHGPDGFWLSYHPKSATLAHPHWYPSSRAAGNGWSISIDDDNELVLALAESPEPAIRTLIDGFLALCADRLGSMSQPTSSCWRQLAVHQRMLDAISSSVIGMDLDGYITSWNHGAEQMFGYTKDETLGRHILFLYAEEDDSDSLIAEAFMSGTSREMLVQRRKRDGTVFWASIHLSLLLDEKGDPDGLMGYLTDATDRVRAEEALRLESAIFEYSGEAILVTDSRGTVVSINHAFSRLFGVSIDDLRGQDSSFLHHRQYSGDFWDQLRHKASQDDRWMGEILCSRRDGSGLPSWLSLSSVRNIEGELTHYIAMLTDVSERRQAEEKIHRLAHFDTLTGLPNRPMLRVLLAQALEESKRSGSHGALLLVDIDRFKRVNDALGVKAGDELLVALAHRIRSILRAEDVVARVGPDEYSIGLFDIALREHASIIAKKILAAIKRPIALSATTGTEEILTVTASIGIVVFPDDGQDPETLLSEASIALSRLRQIPDHEEGYLFFAPDMNNRARERHRLEEELRHALEANELQAYFQPQFHVANGALSGAEVLLRWRHPQRGMVSPGQFIPIAEETGLICDLGDWVLETACASLRHWLDRGLNPAPLAVNLSARQLRPRLEARLTELLAQYGLPTSLLELEITESMLLTENEVVFQLLERLHRLGFSIALDDFGTGYSSLAYLKRLPVDVLKIDRAFICDLPGGQQEAAVVLSILDLAKNHGLSVVAEGVETDAQLQFLRDHGCQVVQGFLLGRPMPKETFEQQLIQDRAQA